MWIQEPLALPFIREARWECFKNEAILDGPSRGNQPLHLQLRHHTKKAIHRCSNLHVASFNRILGFP